MCKFLKLIGYVSLGSDEFQPYSAVYSWGTNQMAHAMMGFFLATVWFYWALKSERIRHTMHPALLRMIPFLVPLVKVLPDYLYIKFVANLSDIFPFDYWEFFSDKGTDLTFWWLGMLLALSLFALPRVKPANRVVLRVGVVIILAIAFSWGYILFNHWSKMKGVLDESYLPAKYRRLCNFPPKIKMSKVDNKKILEYYDYIQNKNSITPVRHLILKGGDPTMRTDLAVTLGVEYTVRGSKVFYTTTAKLLEDPLGTFCRKGINTIKCLIIDDVNGLVEPNNGLAVPSIFEDLDAEGITRQLREFALKQMAPNLTEPSKHAIKKTLFKEALEKLLGQAHRDRIGTIWVAFGDQGKDDFEKWHRQIKDWFPKDSVITIDLESQ